MGASLPRYLEIKVHHKVLERAYQSIKVIGAYRRRNPSIEFHGEKADKPFNWQRPTAREDGDRLLIECFPGSDHVQHYAEIIATYLRILQSQGIILTDPSAVSFERLSCADTQRALMGTNLTRFPQGVDTVVLGLVHRLENLTGPVDWTGDDCFAWTERQFNSRRVAFLGFRPSFWGDISGEIVHFLACHHGVRQVLYFGKLGSVKQGVKPNTWLATGGVSHVRGQVVEWENALGKAVAEVAASYTITGQHVTLGSVLFETKEWLAGLPEAIDFVDPEVGMMAQAAVERGIRFGYLHIISDNVAEKYDEDLSNERKQSVVERRAKLYQLVQDVLGHHLYSGT
ncbi:hypothetical protein BBK36DRAFT_1167102 [Trichoderma citrinoviride]|uniref:Nucleoside phosphorylase domain-containing protein n=1 Tax=Trichoderma citrinoviride TaxID=58853 RepID=A0A2T4BEV3_9HYPO|nr:hypothetical protein BBK36DRAFT_1167102 [Trichoderma citrinoviride]PTB67798.1 hypothetical protein BBK36DRAFT_1167102 [Trichoderma citrinoviride]